jgi:hypothetical protein
VPRFGAPARSRLIISVVIDDNELFSRANESSVRAIRDVLLVPTSDIDDDEVWELHPPAGDPPVELGRAVRLTQELNGPQADVLHAAFTLSRLVLDNACSTEYAARVVALADDRVQIIPGTVNLEGRSPTGRTAAATGNALIERRCGAMI